MIIEEDKMKDILKMNKLTMAILIIINLSGIRNELQYQGLVITMFQNDMMRS